jgi:hypothetical protein
VPVEAPYVVASRGVAALDQASGLALIDLLGRGEALGALLGRRGHEDPQHVASLGERHRGGMRNDYRVALGGRLFDRRLDQLAQVARAEEVAGRRHGERGGPVFTGRHARKIHRAQVGQETSEPRLAALDVRDKLGLDAGLLRRAQHDRLVQ